MSEDLQMRMQTLFSLYTNTTSGKDVEVIEYKYSDKEVDAKLDQLIQESSDYDAVTKRIKSTISDLRTTENDFLSTIEKDKLTMSQLVEAHIKLSNEARAKKNEIFDIEAQCEDQSRMLTAEEQNHKDSIQHKDQVFSVFHNNQDRALRDLKVQYESISKCLEDLKRVNKDTENISELTKSVGFDQTNELLVAKSLAPYDELKLREVNRANDDLKHKISQEAKTNDDQSDRLIALKAKNHDLSNQVKILENYKIVNEQVKAEVEELQGEFRTCQIDEEKLQQQNDYLSKYLYHIINTCWIKLIFMCSSY